EPPESVVSQLGDSLCGKGRLLYPPSGGVVGEDQARRRTPPSRATLPASGRAAKVAPASSTGTVGGESKASGHREAATGPLPGPGSIRATSASPPDTAAPPPSPPAMGL